MVYVMSRAQYNMYLKECHIPVKDLAEYLTATYGLKEAITRIIVK